VLSSYRTRSRNVILSGDLEFAQQIQVGGEGSLEPILLGLPGLFFFGRLTGVFRIFPRLWKIRIRTLYTRVLITMTKLLFQADVAVMMMLFNLNRALCAVRVIS
jgi:hypothetical protein